MAIDVEKGMTNVKKGASFSELILGNSVLPDLEKSNDEVKLRHQINSIDGDKVGRVAILSFRALQLYRIAKLQAALINEQNALACQTQAESAENDERVDALIQRYADAVRNYETLTQAIPFNKNTKYEFLGGNQGFEITTRENISKWYPLEKSEATVVPYGIGPLGFRELDRKRLEKRQLLTAFKLRFHMALIGGTALIVPVVLMVFHSNLYTQLVITSVATVIFATLVVFLGTDSSGKDVLASTAAYTAVLVVFVGASLQVAS
ncbi:hypothetical protein F4680DRAFT_468121 [Xylaria scruposa]|nr:hypothetical protein F4680DRAFT_468121 [Xylaria scruposa]